MPLRTLPANSGADIVPVSATHLYRVHDVAVDGHDQVVVLFLVVVGRELDVQRRPAGRKPRPRAPGPADDDRPGGQVGRGHVGRGHFGRGQVGRGRVGRGKVGRRHVAFVDPRRHRRLQHVRGRVLPDYAPGGRRLDEAQRQREYDPARQRGQQQQLTLAPPAYTRRHRQSLHQLRDQGGKGCSSPPPQNFKTMCVQRFVNESTGVFYR